MTREEIINEIRCLLSELDNGEDAVSYLTQNDVKWLNENIKALKQEPCEDVVSRQAVIDLINKHNVSYGDIFITDKNEFIKCLNELPSATPTKRMGYWIEKSDGIYCSECDVMALSPSYWECCLEHSKYCPNCGARMVGDNIIDLSTDSSTGGDVSSSVSSSVSSTDCISRSKAILIASGYCHFSRVAEELAKLPLIIKNVLESDDFKQKVLERADEILKDRGDNHG